MTLHPTFIGDVFLFFPFSSARMYASVAHSGSKYNSFYFGPWDLSNPIQPDLPLNLLYKMLKIVGYEPENVSPGFEYQSLMGL